MLDKMIEKAVDTILYGTKKSQKEKLVKELDREIGGLIAGLKVYGDEIMKLTDAEWKAPNYIREEGDEVLKYRMNMIRRNYLMLHSEAEAVASKYDELRKL